MPVLREKAPLKEKMLSVNVEPMSLVARVTCSGLVVEDRSKLMACWQMNLIVLHFICKS
jgi:hypothetical protein